MVEDLRRLVHMRSDRCELVHEPLEIRMLGNDAIHLVNTMSSAPTGIPENLERRQFHYLHLAGAGEESAAPACRQTFAVL